MLLLSDPAQADRDTYDRLLRYVHHDGEDIALQLLQAGAARLYECSPAIGRAGDYSEAAERAPSTASADSGAPADHDSARLGEPQRPARLLWPPRKAITWSVTCTSAADEHRGIYAEPPDAPYDRVDPYEMNLDGHPLQPRATRSPAALGPEVEVEEPVMWPGPEIEFHRAGPPHRRDWEDPQEWVKVKLDMSGTAHVTNRGHEITDHRTGELLGIPEQAFTEGHSLAASGLSAGEAAMDPASPAAAQLSIPATKPYEVVEVRSPEQRLAAPQHREVPDPAGPTVAGPGR